MGFQCPECVREGQASVRQPTTRLGGAIHERGNLITTSLILVNVAIWLIVSFTDDRRLTEWLSLAKLTVFVDNGQATVIGVEQGEWYRMFTAAFLHEDIWHIALNMFALWILGSMVEPVLGRWRFLTLYVLSALGGSTASLLGLPVMDLTQGFAGGISLGASGAVFGLFGALFVVARQFGRDVTSVLVILGINAVISFAVPTIDWRAHLGGLITGALLAYLFAVAPAKRRTTFAIVSCVAMAAIILAVTAVLVA